MIPAVVEFVDIAGLVKGASKGEGLGNQFLHHIREVEAICHVLRAFENGDIIHVAGKIAPEDDRSVIETELALADLDVVQKRMEKIQGHARTGDKEKAAELEALQKVLTALEAGKSPRDIAFEKEQAIAVENLHLLSLKPMLYALNVDEAQLKEMTPEKARQHARLPEDTEVIPICAKLEEDLQDLSAEEGRELLKELGVTSSGLDRLAKAAYRLLGYLTFFTAGPKEVRAWTVTSGATAPKAAGVIHTDFEKGFIKAEAISYKDFVQYSGELGAKNAGKMRSEGKEYVVADGDIFHFRFNV